MGARGTGGGPAPDRTPRGRLAGRDARLSYRCAMDRFTAFAELCARLCAVVQHGAQLDLQTRVLELASLLPRLHALGADLPSLPEVTPPPVPPYVPSWPGLGRFDQGVGRISEPLLDAIVWLQAGAVFWEEGDPQRALALWAGGYLRWSPQVAQLLGPLHEAALRFRPEPKKASRAHGPRIVALGAGAQAVPIGVAAPTPPQKAALGVRFEAIGLGAWIREVHPNSPAAGLLDEGDVVLEVDGVSLEHVDPAILAERMVGPVGEERRYLVYRDGESREVRFAAVDVSVIRGAG